MYGVKEENRENRREIKGKKGKRINKTKQTAKKHRYNKIEGRVCRQIGYTEALHYPRPLFPFCWSQEPNTRGLVEP